MFDNFLLIISTIDDLKFEQEYATLEDLKYGDQVDHLLLEVNNSSFSRKKRLKHIVCFVSIAYFVLRFCKF